jgi:hypothetical protein
MAQDIDQLPVYDALIKMDGNRLSPYMSDIWISFMTTFAQTVSETISQFGLFVPQITTSQRDSLNSPLNGQVIYNTSTNKFQGRENGVWVNLI